MVAVSHIDMLRLIVPLGKQSSNIAKWKDYSGMTRISPIGMYEDQLLALVDTTTLAQQKT